MASAQGLGLDRPGVLHPAETINVVDVKVAEETAAGPDEAVKARNLPEQFGRAAARPFFRETGRQRPGHAVAAQQNDVADLAVLEALGQFLEAPGCDGDIKPTPTLRFLAEASSASLSMRREVGPSAVSGFSMKTLRPFWMA